MKQIEQPLQQLEQILKACKLADATKALVKARRFMKYIMEREEHFTKYVFLINYGERGKLDSIDLKLYHMGDSPINSQSTDFYSEENVYRRRR